MVYLTYRNGEHRGGDARCLEAMVFPGAFVFNLFVSATILIPYLHDIDAPKQYSRLWQETKVYLRARRQVTLAAAANSTAIRQAAACAWRRIPVY